MNARTRLSAKGQVVIPKDVRTQLGLAEGQELDVITVNGGVLLRPVQQKSGRSFDELLADFRSRVPPYKGPPISIEEMDEAVGRMWAERGARGDW
ncbi:AbrB/MazE/SpoVT family DNA-binding domain-containing protein [Sphingosinicella sp.]|jgi:AbrB family looped-hinge helix DNA binding protein|uniref:AbrB/MazE/SpoVT family DNA-binding domain-containing protein n=1 Tax=Sphingosinicella sp. TaxID=1917971 RepID=UPI0018582F17|nr:AbrB/MazE/SpoVT family DNA-binding domain-containing protein [Sphingosinicella sp.]MBA4758468.1 AbrB/MazE/SpoVT family DNA-binding domain-containing protein [Sphingosinicella sp.]